MVFRIFFFDWDIFEWVTFEIVKNTDFIDFDEFQSIYYFKNDLLKWSDIYLNMFSMKIVSDKCHYKEESLVGTAYEPYSELILIGNFSFGFKRDDYEPIYVKDAKLRLPRALDSEGRFKLVYIGQPLEQVNE